MKSMFCTICKKIVECADEANYCEKCGIKLERINTINNTKL